MNQRLAISLASFLGWLLITLVGEQLGSGAHQALSETVSRGLGWPFVAAVVFVLAVVAWQRWRDIGLHQPKRTQKFCAVLLQPPLLVSVKHLWLNTQRSRRKHSGS